MKRPIIRIIKAVAASLPALLLLACGLSGEQETFTGFSSIQTTVETTEQEPEAEAEPDTAFVYICGEVVTPGVYQMTKDSRICDVLNLAGGFTKDADREAVNMAQAVEDGMQVVIPAKSEESAATESEDDGKIDINTASSAELQTLPGIGESRAAAIIAYREEKGGFAAPEDIMKVTGIKKSLYADIADLICVR